MKKNEYLQNESFKNRVKDLFAEFAEDIENLRKHKEYTPQILKDAYILANKINKKYTYDIKPRELLKEMGYSVKVNCIFDSQIINNYLLKIDFSTDYYEGIISNIYFSLEDNTLCINMQTRSDFLIKNPNYFEMEINTDLVKRAEAFRYAYVTRFINPLLGNVDDVCRDEFWIFMCLNKIIICEDKNQINYNDFYDDFDFYIIQLLTDFIVYQRSDYKYRLNYWKLAMHCNEEDIYLPNLHMEILNHTKKHYCKFYGITVGSYEKNDYPANQRIEKEVEEFKTHFKEEFDALSKIEAPKGTYGIQDIRKMEFKLS